MTETARAKVGDEQAALLRHLVATIAHRASIAIENAPEGFARFHAGKGTMTPLELLEHICGLLSMTGLCLGSAPDSVPAAAGNWQAETSRFRAAVDALDETLAAGACVKEGTRLENLLQGPLSDAMTHVGQLALLRRLWGSPVRRENFFLADVRPGKPAAEPD